MNMCPHCGGSIPETGAPCARCGPDEPAAVMVPASSSSLDEGADATQAASQSPSPPEPAPADAAAGKRLAIAAGVVACAGAGLLSLALFAASPSADRDAAAPAREAAPLVPTAARPAAAPRGGVWSSANQARWVANHQRSVAFEVEADSDVSAWMARVRPRLVVRCLSRTTEVFVFTESAARMEAQDGNHTVRISFDGEPAREERWPDSAEHDALFAPDGEAFARRLARAQRLGFGFTPHNAPPVTVGFTVAGGDEAIATVAKTCGWNPAG